MFSYMGAKWRTAKKYGRPHHPIVVEPFAGSACYSLYWNVQKAILYDCNPIIAGIWEYLITVSESEVLALPVDFDTVDDLYIPQEAKWLIGFWITKGNVHPNKSRAAWARQYRHSGDCKVWGEAARSRISKQVSQIREWEIHCQDYRDIQNIEAQWFIDPPYQIAGKHYPFSDVDFNHLADYCRSRKGSVIACENAGADWLPFKPFADARAMIGQNRTGVSKEVVWYGASSANSFASNWLEEL
jgi:site-specific DNA-adenine methylase